MKDKTPLDIELKTVGQITKVKEEILEQLNDEQLYTQNKNELCFHVLSFFDFPENSLKMGDEITIKNCCQIVLSKMGFDENYVDPSTDEKIEPINDFIDKFLEFKEIPGIYYKELSNLVHEDLNNIDGKISYYENIEFIKNKEKPRNHDERTKSDFYKRCITEKEEIQNYLSNGIKKRSIEKAQNSYFPGSFIKLFDSFYDRPYRSSYPNAQQYFDIEQIDSVTHRLGNLTIQSSNDLISLYKNDKKQFYLQLELKIPIANTFQLLLNYINFAPLIPNQRIEIFKQLKELYELGKYYGFYALALTQIEGLFGDMCQMCEPEYSNPKASISDKVAFIRTFYKQNETDLDYFQFKLPKLRNLFLHKGIDTNEEIDILCREVLYDLLECIKIYTTLDTSSNWFNILIKNVTVNEFHSVDDFCFYFDLIKDVKKKKQFQFFENRILYLNENVFPDLIWNIAFELSDNFLTSWEQVRNLILGSSAYDGDRIDIDLISNNEIQQNRDTIKKIFENHGHILNDEIKKLLNIKKFIQTYKNYINVSRLSENSKDVFERFSENYILQLEKIFQIYEIGGK